MNSIQQSDFVELIRKYIRNWKLFVLSFVCCIGLAVAYLVLKNPEFKMEANVLIKEDSKSGMSTMAATMMKGMPGFGDMLNVGGGTVDDEVEVIGSYSILYEAARELGLNTVYLEKKLFNLKNKHHYKDSPLKLTCDLANMADTFMYNIKFDVTVERDQVVKVKATYDGDKIGEAVSTFPVHISTIFGDFTLNKTPYLVPEEKLKMKILYYGYGWTTEELMKKVTIDVASKKSNVINLMVKDVIMARGIDLLNAIISNYNDYGIAEKNLEANRTAEFLQQRINLMDGELKQVEIELENYKTANQLTDIDTEAQIILEKNSDFKEQLIKAETQFTVISMIEDFLKAPENRYAVVPMSLGIEEKSAVESLLKYNELLLQRLKLLRSTNPGNPMIESMNEQVDATRLSVLVTIQSIKRGIEYARNDLRMQEEMFMSRIKGMPLQEREYVEIRRQQEIKQALFIYLLQKQEENALKLAVANPKAQIIDNGFAYNKPVAPKKLLIAAAALLFAFLLPMLYLYLRRMFSEKFSTEAEFQEIAGDLKTVHPICYSKDDQVYGRLCGETPAMEDFRRLRSDVTLMLGGCPNHKTLMVGSMFVDVGKSFIAYNLAHSYAQTGMRVVLIDTDMRYQRSNRKGIYDVVRGDADVTDLLEFVDPNFFRLNPGVSGTDSPEVLLNPKFFAMLDRLKQEFDLLVIDSLALAQYSDCLSLLDYADALLFVFRAGSSTRTEVSYLESFVAKYQLENKSACLVNDLKPVR